MDFKTCMRTRPLRTLAIAALACISTACSTPTYYEPGREWQRVECNKLLDESEREGCLQRINPKHDNNQRQTPGPAP
jgi:hypothetical protein